MIASLLETIFDRSEQNHITTSRLLLEGEEILRKEDYEALARFRYTLRRFLHLTEERARAAGITPQQHQLLLAVKGQPGRDWASVSDLAEALQVRHHAAVGLVDRCERASLAVRAPDPEDRRQVRVSLTPHGEELLETLSRQNQEELRILQAALLLPFLSEASESTPSK